MNIEDIIRQAELAAYTEANRYFQDEMGGVDNYPCGFAWVNIKPARGKFVNTLKKLGIGRPAYEGGYNIHNPCKLLVQNMDVKYIGAMAYAKVLNDNGIKAIATSRLD